MAPFVAGGVDASSLDVPLRDLGVDSVKLIELIGALERSFGATFADEDITPENFKTPRTLLALVARRSPAAG